MFYIWSIAIFQFFKLNYICSALIYKLFIYYLYISFLFIYLSICTYINNKVCVLGTQTTCPNCDFSTLIYSEKFSASECMLFKKIKTWKRCLILTVNYIEEIFSKVLIVFEIWQYDYFMIIKSPCIIASCKII